MFVNSVSANGNNKLLCNHITNDNVHFSGNFMKLERDMFVSASSHLKPKVMNIGDELVSTATRGFRKLFGKKELPIAKKASVNPILQNGEEFIMDAARGNRTAQHNIDILNKYDIKVSDIPADNGLILSHQKRDIFRQIDQKVENGSMTTLEAEEAKRGLDFDHSDMVEIHSHADDVLVNSDIGSRVIDTDMASTLSTDTFADPDISSRVADGIGDSDVLDTVIEVAGNILGALFGF